MGAITARWGWILIPDDKLDCFGIMRKKFGSDRNGLAFYPGPVLPPRTDGCPLLKFDTFLLYDVP